MRRDNNEVRAGIDKIFHRVLPLIIDTCQANRRVWTLSDNLSNKQISQLEKHRASNWLIGHYATETIGLTFIGGLGVHPPNRFCRTTKFTQRAVHRNQDALVSYHYQI
jgi:hypothetical protein